jgi:hypothetical protein
MVSDTNASDTKATLANFTDPYMGRVELAELIAESGSALLRVVA